MVKDEEDGFGEKLTRMRALGTLTDDLHGKGTSCVFPVDPSLTPGARTAQPNYHHARRCTPLHPSRPHTSTGPYIMDDPHISVLRPSLTALSFIAPT